MNWPKVLGDPPDKVKGENRHARRTAAAQAYTRCNSLAKYARKRRHLARGTGYATPSHPTKYRDAFRTEEENARRLRLTIKYENMIYDMGERLGIWQVPARGPGSCRSIFRSKRWSKR